MQGSRSGSSDRGHGAAGSSGRTARTAEARTGRSPSSRRPRRTGRAGGRSSPLPVRYAPALVAHPLARITAVRSRRLHYHAAALDGRSHFFNKHNPKLH